MEWRTFYRLTSINYFIVFNIIRYFLPFSNLFVIWLQWKPRFRYFTYGVPIYFTVKFCFILIILCYFGIMVKFKYVLV